MTRGRPERRIPALAKSVGATAVHVSADFSPFGRRRDDAVRDALGDIPLEASGSPYLVSPGRVVKGSGEPYKVFTPFFDAWRKHGWRAPAKSGPKSANWIDPADVKGGVEIPDAGVELELPAGEQAALRQWKKFVSDGLADYADARNRPDLPATSRMSAHLKFGTIHPRTMVADLGRGNGRAGLPAGVGFSRLLRRGAERVARQRMVELEQELRHDAGRRRRRGQEGVRGVEGRTDRVPDRRRRNAPARRDRLDAQPGADDRRVVPGQGSAPAVAVGRALVPRAAGGRRHGQQPARLAMGGGYRHRRRAVFPGVQPDDPGREVRSRRRIRPALGSRSGAPPTIPTRSSTTRPSAPRRCAATARSLERQAAVQRQRDTREMPAGVAAQVHDRIGDLGGIHRRHGQFRLLRLAELGLVADEQSPSPR